MRVVVVPGTGWGRLAAEVAASVEGAWTAAAPRDAVRALLLSDGGPGFAEAARAASGGHPAPSSPLVLDASMLGAGAGDVLTGSSYELGRMIAGAVQTDARRIVVGLGTDQRTGIGWADAGAGLLAGVAGRGPGSLTAGGAALSGITPGDLPGLATLRAGFGEKQVVVGTRSLEPLLGPRGVAGRLVGAGAVTAAGADALERSLSDFARAVAQAAGGSLVGRDLLRGDALRRAPGSEGAAAADARDLAARPGSGAGGGVGFVLGLLGAEVRRAIDLTAELAGLDEVLDGADLVLVVPPRLDAAEMHDGVTPLVSARSLERGLPVVVLTGESHAGRREWSAAGVSAVYGPDRRAVAGHEQTGPAPAGRAEPHAHVLNGLVSAVAPVARTWSR